MWPAVDVAGYLMLVSGARPMLEVVGGWARRRWVKGGGWIRWQRWKGKKGWTEGGSVRGVGDAVVVDLLPGKQTSYSVGRARRCLAASKCPKSRAPRLVASSRPSRAAASAPVPESGAWRWSVRETRTRGGTRPRHLANDRVARRRGSQTKGGRSKDKDGEACGAYGLHTASSLLQPQLV